MRRLTFVDVFAGAGGFSLGLHEAGLKGLFAVEKDAMAFDTLSSNLLQRVAFAHFKYDNPAVNLGAVLLGAFVTYAAYTAVFG